MQKSIEKEIITGLRSVKMIYETRGFVITDIHADNEFNINSVKEAMLPSKMTIYAKNEHVPVVERSIRTIKERCRCHCHSVPYKRHTKLMTRQLVENVVHWLNAFPSKNGISKVLSPSTIVTGSPKPDFSKEKIAWGSYAMAYTQTSNNMQSRSIPAIALCESNERGGHYFMSLYSGKEIHSYKWKELPINDEVIDRVHELAISEKQKVLLEQTPLFEWRPGILFDDVLEDVEDVKEREDPELQNEIEVLMAEEEDADNDNENDRALISEDEDVPVPDLEEIVESNESDDDDESDDENKSIDSSTVDDGNEKEGDQSENSAESRIIVLDVNEDKEDHDEELHTDDVETQQDSGRPRRTNAGTGVERLTMNNDGKWYASNRQRQFVQKKVPRDTTYHHKDTKKNILGKGIRCNLRTS